MSYKGVLDSYAWIEYFRGSNKGEKVKKYVENKNSYTPVIVVAELSAKYHREKWDFWEDDLKFILAKSIIIELTLEIAVNAGKTRNEIRQKKKGFGLADAIILETSKEVNAPVITGDPHFVGLENVVYIGD
jgi:predicted nucleic acid-binding protein